MWWVVWQWVFLLFIYWSTNTKLFYLGIFFFLFMSIFCPMYPSPYDRPTEMPFDELVVLLVGHGIVVFLSGILSEMMHRYYARMVRTFRVTCYTNWQLFGAHQSVQISSFMLSKNVFAGMIYFLFVFFSLFEQVGLQWTVFRVMCMAIKWFYRTDSFQTNRSCSASPTHVSRSLWWPTVLYNLQDSNLVDLVWLGIFSYTHLFLSLWWY